MPAVEHLRTRFGISHSWCAIERYRGPEVLQCFCLVWMTAESQPFFFLFPLCSQLQKERKVRRWVLAGCHGYGYTTSFISSTWPEKRLRRRYKQRMYDFWSNGQKSNFSSLNTFSSCCSFTLCVLNVKFKPRILHYSFISDQWCKIAAHTNAHTRSYSLPLHSVWAFTPFQFWVFISVTVCLYKKKTEKNKSNHFVIFFKGFMKE